jgi:hypothetical protein
MGGTRVAMVGRVRVLNPMRRITMRHAVGRALAVFGSVVVLASLLPALAMGQAGPVEPGAGRWRTWVLASGKEMRLPAPPDSQKTAAEIQEVRALAGQRDAAALARIRHWDFGSPAYRWNEMLTDLGARDDAGTAAGIRAFALLNVAIHDALVAAWDSKYAHNRRRPSEIDPTITTAVSVPRSPSYPCEHAVAAGAAAAVLAAIFPKDAERLTRAADEAAQSRVAAGAVFPSDARAGLEIGRAVAARVIAHTRTDGTKWSGTVPAGPGLWKGTDPVGIDQMRWKTFVLTSASQFRPGPPPAPDSPERAAEVAEVKTFKRTPATLRKAAYWQFGQHGQAGLHYLFSDEIGRRLAEAGIDGTTIPTPPFPSYPSNAAAVGMAPAVVLAHLFPREAERYMRWAKEFGDSRLWSGIHFRSDIESGWELGRRVGEAVRERARRDGAE